jgi:hypothetical protein
MFCKHMISHSVMGSRDGFENYFKLPGTKSSHYSCLWMVTVIASAQDFSLLQCIQTNSGSHPASYSMDIRGSFSCGKVAGAYSWLNSI